LFTGVFIIGSNKVLDSDWSVFYPKIFSLPATVKVTLPPAFAYNKGFFSETIPEKTIARD
jgi:hypothetical protein